MRNPTLVLIVRAAFVLWVSCVIVAIIVQDHTSTLPLGLFNTGSSSYTLLANGFLLLAVAVLSLLITELVSGRITNVAGTLRGIIASIVLLDALLLLGDRLFVTGDPDGRLGQYYEEPLDDGAHVILKKTYGTAIVDPCGADHNGEEMRVLFLGDSYTEGSGRGAGCNYPDVVEDVLREGGYINARVANAGVSGYGPVEALNLLRWYRQRNCPIDAIVYNVFLENDLTDNLPATERRVVAGIIFRFPSAWFLRTFHPLNSRTFRWSLVLFYMSRVSDDIREAITVERGECDPSEDLLEEVNPFLRATVERRLSGSARVAASAQGLNTPTEAILAMQTEAAQMGVPFILAIFPDRALADPQLQEEMDITAGRLAPVEKIRSFVHDALRDTPVVDVTDVLGGRAGMYRDADTHLSDLGNIVAGRFVGEELLRHLGRVSTPARGGR